VTRADDEDHESNQAGVRRPLEGRRICLVFEHSLSHYSRLLVEIEGLQKAGASVSVLTQHARADAPGGVTRIYAPLGPNERLVRSIRDSRMPRWRLRRVDDALRRLIRTGIRRWTSAANAFHHRSLLRRLARHIDAFWVIDFPQLAAVMAAAAGERVKVIYETVDLVPEYRQHGVEYRLRALDDERRLIGKIDGFVTACESYADYYVETYGDGPLQRRPVVRDNMPREIASGIVPTNAPIRFLFLGSLMFDRPVLELIDAIAGASIDVTLTFQGPNYLGEDTARLVAERIADPALGGRVEILPPCPPDRIVETANAYDVGIVALRGADENERRASTGKLFTYIAAGLALLGSDLPGIARVVNEHENGLLVAGMDPRAWSIAMNRLVSMPPELIDTMKRRSLQAAHRYSWETQGPAYVGEFVRALS
jgi:glycosyltransferase involved in cell wall biosynthesis